MSYRQYQFCLSLQSSTHNIQWMRIHEGDYLTRVTYHRDSQRPCLCGSGFLPPVRALCPSLYGTIRSLPGGPLHLRGHLPLQAAKQWLKSSSQELAAPSPLLSNAEGSWEEPARLHHPSKPSVSCSKESSQTRDLEARAETRQLTDVQMGCAGFYLNFVWGFFPCYLMLFLSRSALEACRGSRLVSRCEGAHQEVGMFS